MSVTVPAGAKHNIINTGKDELKLYTLYSPPEHEDGLVQKTKPEE
jgi:mannose-6-phosphate isomerase-like protein (cupin superfamily)